jgi:hypothetical protein
MIKRHAAALAATILLAGCGNRTPDSAATAKPDAQTAAPAPLYVRAHTLKALMANVVDPQAQIFWHSSGSVSDATGDHDLTPTTDEGWNKTRSAAATVTEMGNLLMTPLYAKGRGEDWIQLSQALVQTGMKAEKAAADHNSDAVFETGGTLYEVCSACHQAYPPPVPPPPVMPAIKPAA